METPLFDIKKFRKKLWMTAGIFSLTIVLLCLFKVLFSIILLLLAGILIPIYFHAFATALTKWIHVPKKIAVFTSVLLNLIFLALFFWFVGARLESQISELSDSLPNTIEHAKKSLQQNPVGEKILNYLNTSADSDKTLTAAKNFFYSSFGIISDLYIILLLALFFTANPTIYIKGFILLIPPKAKDETNDVLNEIHTVLKNWIKGQLFGFLFIAVLTGLGLWIIGIPLILSLALVAGLMNFIPNFGPLIALVPAFLLALMQDMTTALIVVGLYTGIQVIQSAVTQPLIQKKMVNIPPALIVFGQVALGILAGFWGVLLAAPVLGILVTITDKVYVTRINQNK